MDEEIKILCVDDEPNVLSSLRRLFMDEDYTILTAASAGEGLGILEKERVQLVISDFRMPSMNGVEFLKKVYSQWPDTVRMVLSGYADASAIVSAINEGHIYKFVPKPWNDDDLKVTVANAIERFFLYKKNKELTVELRKRNEDLSKLNTELKNLLDFRSQALQIQQNILDSIPVGIMGVDFDNEIVLCNSTWIKSLNTDWSILGRNVSEALPGCITDMIEGVKKGEGPVCRLEMNGARGHFIGSLMEVAGGQKGIVLVFVREADING